MRPFEKKCQARYWGGGVLAEDTRGGWWSLHGYYTPSGPVLFAVGRDGRTAWPATLVYKYVWVENAIWKEIANDPHAHA
jgi:hypothetical protein